MNQPNRTKINRQNGGKNQNYGNRVFHFTSLLQEGSPSTLTQSYYCINNT